MSSVRILFLLFSLNVLAACQSANNIPPANKADAVATPPSPVVAIQPKVTKQSTAKIEQQKPAPQNTAPPRIFPNIDVLRGATPDQLNVLIGAPDFLRKDKPAEFWQYRSSVCRLDLILYERQTSTNMTVDYFSVKALRNITSPNSISNKACLTSLIKQFEDRTTTN